MSDKLLNDFMAVVYRQRRMPPEKEDVKSMARDLAASDLVTSFMADEDGHRLLGTEDLEAIAPSLRRARYTAGETLFRQGETGESCFVVVRGRLSGRMEFKESIPANEFEIGPGALVGEMSLMTGLPRTATIIAREESELLEINHEAFRLLLGRKEKIPELLSRLVAARAAANSEAMEKLRAITKEDVENAGRHENIFKRFLRLLKR
jgi:CRP-like cAMP-binding protein